MKPLLICVKKTVLLIKPSLTSTGTLGKKIISTDCVTMTDGSHKF